MKLKVLGCSGGIGGPYRSTTSLMLDNDILVDCGTGAGQLTIDELARIDHVFLTHAHLDHIACLPLMIDSVGDLRERPLVVHGTAGVIDALHRHVFNGSIWPDFTRVPSPEQPFLRFETLRLGGPVVLAGRHIEALPADHVVPANGYRIDSGRASIAFSGDTGPCPAMWAAINRIGNLRTVIIETAFPNRERALAERSKHLCPSMLKDELDQLRQDAEIFITHLKPGQCEAIMQEIQACLGARNLRMLEQGQVLEF